MKRFIATILLVLVACIGYGQTSHNVNLLTKTFPEWDRVLDVDGRGSRFFVSAGTDGMYVMGYSSYGTPVFLGHIDTPGQAQGVGSASYVLLVADGAAGVRIVDLDDPGNPVDVGSIPALDYVRGATGSYESAYVADSDAGLRIFDSVDPANPVQMSVYDTPGTVYDVYAYKHSTYGYAYIADGPGGFRVLDIADLSNPVEIHHFEFPTDIIDVSYYTRGNQPDLILLAAGEGGVWVLDASDPFNPFVLAQLETPGFAEKAVADDNLITIADGEAGITNYIFDDDEWQWFSQWDTPGYASAVIRHYDNAIVADDDFNLRMIDVAATTPRESCTYPPINASEIVYLDNKLYMTDDHPLGTLSLFDVEEPANPLLIDSDWRLGPLTNLAVPNDNFAYVTVGEDGLRACDVTYPTNIHRESILNTTGFFHDVAVQEDIAYVAAGTIDLHVIDVSDPSSLSLLGTLYTSTTTTDVAVYGDFVFTAGGDAGMQVIDVSDPTSPAEVNVYSSGLSVDLITIVYPYAYIAEGGMQMTILDITDPLSIEVCGSVDANDVLDIIVDTDYDRAYLASESDGLRVIEVFDPYNPVERGYYDLPDPTTSVAYEDHIAYAVSAGNLYVLDVKQSWPQYSVFIDSSEPVVVPAGGLFTYNALLISNLTMVQQVDVWVEAILPNGNTYGPIWRVDNLTMSPGLQIYANGLLQEIPNNAAPGMYTYRMTVGQYPNGPVSEDEFPVQVEASGAMAAGSSQWTLWGMEEAFGEISVTDPVAAGSALPNEYAVNAAYPNPFNPTTTLNVALPEAANLTVVAYNVAGQQVAEIAHGQYTAGQHNLTFDASNLASGLYFIRATVPGKLNATQKVMLVR